MRNVAVEGVVDQTLALGSLPDIRVMIFGEEQSAWGEVDNVQSFTPGCLQLLKAEATSKLNVQELEKDLYQAFALTDVALHFTKQGMAGNHEGPDNYNEIESVTTALSEKIGSVLDALELAQKAA